MSEFAKDDLAKIAMRGGEKAKDTMMLINTLIDRRDEAIKNLTRYRLTRNEALALYNLDKNLSRADLSEANMHGVDLSEADLSEASLRGVDLSDACLIDANLHRANLSGADLRGAYMRGVILGGAIVDWANFNFARDICVLYVDGMSSRGDVLVAVRHDDCVMVQAGCRWASLDDFEAVLEEKHTLYKLQVPFLREWGNRE